MRIPKKVRTMAMSRFIEEHAGDVHKALFAELTKPATSAQAIDSQHKQTPTRQAPSTTVPPTSARIRLRSCSKTANPSSRKRCAATLEEVPDIPAEEVLVELDDGTIVNLAHEDSKNMLTGENKERAKERIASLQAQLGAILAGLST
mmetsp:Transcript_45115/g.116686  ORF Transcript_45115/g.116686 Transcript_45115/m.116686 type:complete len:147 (-) Transcript_45115:1443-1883(-)